MKNGKKYFVSILVILLVVAMLLTLTCCNKKKQEEQKRKEEASVAITTSEDFTVLDDGTLYCGVENDTDKYILKGKFTVPGGASIKFYETADGETPGKEITNLTISLKEGQNILLAVVRNGKASKTYKINLYRKMHVTVTFDTPSHEVPSQTLIEGECAVEPTVIPTRLGYKFVGWKFDFAEPVFENVTVKAMWEAEAYTITYESDGGILYDEKGEVVTGNTQKVHYGENVKYYVPLKEGYRFQGWYVGDYKQNDGEWKRLSDTTFTAHWSIMSLDVKVTPNLKGAGDITGEGDYNYNDECTLSVSPYNGYRFLGWYDKHGELITENFTYTVILKESNIRVDARFKTVLPEMEPYLFDTDDEVHYIVKGMRNNALTEIEIPECVVGIREGSFNVNALQKLTIPFIGTDENDAKNYKTLNSMFSNGIPSSLTTVHVTGECYVNNSTFSNAQNITTLTFDDVRRIEKEAFYNNRYLTKLEVSGSIEYVGYNIFYYSSNNNYMPINFTDFNEYDNALYLGNDENPYIVLFREKTLLQSTCNIHSNTKVIAGKAFNLNDTSSYDYSTYTYGTALDVTLPNGLVSVGEKAFYYRKLSSSVSLPSSLKNIGASAFYYSFQSGGINLTFGNNLERIDASAFSSCNGINSVVLPDSLTTLGEYAFNSCYMSSVTFGQGLTSIPRYAFYRNNFTSLTIPDCVKTIENSAFGCCKLTSVTIGKGLKNIDALTFYNEGYSSDYNDITSLSISADNETYYGTNCIIEKATDKLVLAAKNAVLPEGLKEIGEKAFYYSKIAYIEIPASVKKIDNYAFYNCASLGSVTFKEGSLLEEIGDYAFAWCYNTYFNSIILPASVKKIGDNAFYACYNLSTVSLPDALEYVGQYVFESINSSAFILEDNVYYMGNADNKYVYVKGLANTSVSSVTLKDGVKCVDKYIFQNCYNLTSLTMQNEENIDMSFLRYAKYVSITENYVQYRGTTSNPYYYVCGTSSQNSSYSINSNAKIIGEGAFKNNGILNNIYIPNSIVEIMDNAFNYCYNLNSVDFGTGLKKIGNYAFANDNRLNYITFPDSLEEIGDYAFAWCYNLCDVTIPGSVKTIGNQAFYNCCYGMYTVTINEGVEELGSQAFAYSYRINKIYIPVSVKSFGDNLFTSNSALKDVDYAGTIEQWNEIRKEQNWGHTYNAFKVHCTDGDISYSGQQDY